MEIPSSIAAGTIKYQKCSSKKDSSSILHIDDEHAIVVIISHLYND